MVYYEKQPHNGLNSYKYVCIQVHILGKIKNKMYKIERYIKLYNKILN